MQTLHSSPAARVNTLPLLIGIRGDTSQPGPTPPCSAPDRRGFVGECEGVWHQESRGQQPKCGHGDSGDTWPSPGKGGLLMEEGSWDRDVGCWGRGSRGVCSHGSWSLL